MHFWFFADNVIAKPDFLAPLVKLEALEAEQFILVSFLRAMDFVCNREVVRPPLCDDSTAFALVIWIRWKSCHNEVTFPQTESDDKYKSHPNLASGSNRYRVLERDRNICPALIRPGRSGQLGAFALGSRHWQ